MARSPRRVIASVLLAGLATAVAMAIGVPGGCANDWTGTISSARLKEIPEGATYDVLIYDDRDENLEFRDQFLKALSGAGYATGRDARLVFSFDPEFTRPDPGYRRPGDRKADLSGAGRYEQGGARVGVSSDEWMLGNKKRWVFRRTHGLRRPNQPDRLHVIVRLRDTRSGTVIWTADLYCDLLAVDRERIVRSIIGPIVARLGQTRSVESFMIR